MDIIADPLERLSGFLLAEHRRYKPVFIKSRILLRELLGNAAHELRKGVPERAISVPVDADPHGV